MGYFKVRIPLLDCASSPTWASFCPIPTITPWWRGRPTMEGKTARGASSPANPALHMPEPLSQTRAATSSSHIFDLLINLYRYVLEYTIMWTDSRHIGLSLVAL